MRLDSFIARNRIINLTSETLDGAVDELLATCKLDKDPEAPSARSVHSRLMEREATMTTYLGNGIALPHLRMKMKRRYLIAVGRSANGISSSSSSSRENGRIHQVYLLLANEGARAYLNVLASLARVFQDPQYLSRLNNAGDLNAFRDEVKRIFGGDAAPQHKQNKFNRLILREAEVIAKGSRCTHIVIAGDTFAGGVEITRKFRGFETVLISQGGSDSASAYPNIDAIVPVRSLTANRLSQIRSAVLVGLTRGIFSFNSRLCFVGGIPQSNQFDTLVVIDIEREFRSIISLDTNFLPPSVRPDVVERVLAIATELAVEGREGKPVGCLFVLGDTSRVRQYIKPLVLNPFFGYKEEDKNILNPFMDETVKELSTIDGAFIIRGDGVLEAAGSLIHAPDYEHNLPSGLGSRHAAAASITRATESLSIVVSGSTGQVTLFRRGEMLRLIEKTLGPN